MKKLIIFLVCLAGLSFVGGVQAQTWHDAKDAGYHVFGQGWSQKQQKKYQRVPPTMRARFANSKLSTSSQLSTGLYVRFRTDATAISVKYDLTQAATQHYFVSTFGQSGVDLYARSDDAKTYHWLAPHVGKASFGSPATTNYQNIIPTNMEGNSVCEYVLYLPSLNGVSSLQVGTTNAKTFEWLEVSEESPYIIAYGGASVQGASASHPGNIWTNIVGRALDIPVMNFGFMNLAKLDKSVFNVLSELTPQVYIIDAMADMKAEPEAIVSRILEDVEILRAANQSPILLVESPGVPDKIIQPKEEALYVAANAQLKEAYNQLKAAGYYNIFYMTQEELGLGEDDFLDGVDVNDLGMKRYADAYLKKLAYIEANKEIVPDAVNEVTTPAKSSSFYDLGGRRVEAGLMPKGNVVVGSDGQKVVVTK